MQLAEKHHARDTILSYVSGNLHTGVHGAYGDKPHYQDQQDDEGKPSADFFPNVSVMVFSSFARVCVLELFDVNMLTGLSERTRLRRRAGPAPDGSYSKLFHVTEREFAALHLQGELRIRAEPREPGYKGSAGQYTKAFSF